MNKLIGAMAATTIVLTAVSSAQPGNSPEFPPGISVENWIPVGSSAGFVVTNGDFQGSDRATGSLKGYFVLRRGGTWFRVVQSGP